MLQAIRQWWINVQTLTMQMMPTSSVSVTKESTDTSFFIFRLKFNLISLLFIISLYSSLDSWSICFSSSVFISFVINYSNFIIVEPVLLLVCLSHVSVKWLICLMNTYRREKKKEYKIKSNWIASSFLYSRCHMYTYRSSWWEKKIEHRFFFC
jgi:hypothetical protein